MAEKSNGFDWNDSIEKDESEFVVLPEGDYKFEVGGLERGWFPGSAKIDACNKAGLTLIVDDGKGGTVDVKTDLILTRVLEWKIASFFRSIGMKKKGEKLNMDWDHIVGKRGKAHFKPRTWTGSDGKEHQTNDVDAYLDYDPNDFPEFVPMDDSGDLPF